MWKNTTAMYEKDGAQFPSDLHICWDAADLIWHLAEKQQTI